MRLRFRDLRLRLDDCPIKADVDRLHGELERRGIRFKPHVWLSTEWFSPDGVPGIAAPFFAAHPRLRRLEQRMMGEVEGGNRKWRNRILRHEAGHALDTAYRLRRRKDWREVFGKASRPYPRGYRVRPNSRGFVQHIGFWYAQSHPVEDFAETFAVWMQPKARWRREYDGWPALEKLEYVDELMAEISERAPANRNRSVVAPLSQNNRTLGEHYRRKTAYSGRIDRRYDDWLREIFFERSSKGRARRASRFISDMRPQLRRLLLSRTSSGPYLIDHVIDKITLRARQLDLVIAGPRRENKRNVVWLHENVIYDVLRRNRDYFAL
ncbi:MAG TPA: putative zinc-binding metallopeptidase [Gammaproteobacteria bacterium]|nr:putative zinc-binding metallopeptidase [Gammaproteobacteria bacterium]